MWPILLEIPIGSGIRIHTYGALVATAFMVGILWTAREARLAGHNKELVYDLSFTIILSALIGSRILYILLDWRNYLHHPANLIKIWEGGLVFYGGLIAAVAASLIYCRKKNLRFLSVADLYMPGLCLGHAIGRLGCLAAGCCVGRLAPTGAWWALTFPNLPYSLAPKGVSLYPSQLLESFASLLLFFLLILVRRKKRFEGELLFVYLLIYGLSRSILEVFRADEARSFFLSTPLSVSQIVSGFLILAGAWIYLSLRKRGS